MLPASVVPVSGVQTCWSFPALATGLFSSNTVIVTWSLEKGVVHGPLVTAHWNTFRPTLNPLTSVLGSFGSAKMPVPVTTVQPTAGVLTALPVKVVFVVGAQFLVGARISRWCVIIIQRWSTYRRDRASAGPFETVQTKVFAPMPSALTVVAGSLASAKVPDPDHGPGTYQARRPHYRSVWRSWSACRGPGLGLRLTPGCSHRIRGCSPIRRPFTQGPLSTDHWNTFVPRQDRDRRVLSLGRATFPYRHKGPCAYCREDQRATSVVLSAGVQSFDGA